MRDLHQALVLGGSGFIGRWLVETLASAGIELTLLDRKPPTRSPAIASVVTDTVNYESVVHTLQDRPPDVVFHLAGASTVPPSIDDPIDDLHRNVVTTVEVLEALRSLAQQPLLVFISSAAVYGDAQHHPIDEDHPLAPKSPYGVSKLAAEGYVRLYTRLHGIRGISVRPFSVYGPGQRKLVIYDLLDRIKKGERPLTILGSPDVSRDFVFVGDVSRALLRLARTAPAEGEAYNIATGVGTSLGELAALLIDVSKADTETHFTGQVRQGDPLHWTGDPSRALALGVKCDTPLRDGLRRTADWMGRLDHVGTFVR